MASLEEQDRHMVLGSAVAEIFVQHMGVFTALLVYQWCPFPKSSGFHEHHLTSLACEHCLGRLFQIFLKL